MKLFDAHNHWHHRKLERHRPEIDRELGRIGLARAIVNGTREEDWGAVAALAETDERAWPAFGIHPWFAAGRSEHWREALKERLNLNANASVGEIGLDRWIEGHDLADQSVLFSEQLDLAVELQRPATIHCIQAWGALWDIIREHEMPAVGFLLHAFGGSAEMAGGFLDRGAFFSFSPSFLHDRKSAQREVFRNLPIDRLLVETDAPDLRPPEERNIRPLTDEAGEPINHPANLDVAYAGLAELRGCSLGELAGAVEKNFCRLFARDR